MKSNFFTISFVLLMMFTLFGCTAQKVVRVLGQEHTYQSTGVRHDVLLEVYTERTAQAYINIARGWLSLKNYPYAIKAYEELMEECPMEKYIVESLFQIGKIYQDIGDYEKAIKTYHTLLLEAPESSRRDEVIYRQAVCLESIHAFTAAYECYKIYINLGEDKEFYHQVREKIKQMEYDGDGDGYPLYKEQEAGTSDDDANSYPMSFPLISPGYHPN